MENSTYQIAKRIRQEMTTEKAECYRLSKLAGTTTVKSVQALYEAMMTPFEDERYEERWEKVKKTPMYKDKKHADYTHVLAYISLVYRK